MQAYVGFAKPLPWAYGLSHRSGQLKADDRLLTDALCQEAKCATASSGPGKSVCNGSKGMGMKSASCEISGRQVFQGKPGDAWRESQVPVRLHPVSHNAAKRWLILALVFAALVPGSRTHAGFNCRAVPLRVMGIIERYIYHCERTFDSGSRPGGNFGERGGGDRGSGGRDEHSGSEGDPNEEQEKPLTNCPTAGNPVVLATGNKVERETDFTSGGEMPLFLERVWNSKTLTVTLFGYHWTSNFDYRLGFNTNSAFGPTGTCYARPSVPACANTASYTTIYAHRPDGRIIKFVKNPTTGIYWEDRPNPLSKMVRQADGKWLITFEDNLSELYTSGGLPVWVQDEHGLRWTYTYGGLQGTQVQRVTHTSGRYVQFIWVDDELREVRDPGGNAYLFTYYNQKFTTGLHTLKTVTLPGTPATTITYHYSGEGGEPSQGGLTGKSYAGVRYSTFGYSGGRATSTKHAGNVESYTFSYTAGQNGELTTTVTNPLGKQTTYDFLDTKLLAITGHPSAHCPSLMGSDFTYDANGFRDKATDFNGNVTDYDYSAKGQLLKKVEALGKPEARTTTYVWDAAANRVNSVTIAGHSKEDYTFYADGRLKSIKVTNLKSTGVTNQSRTTNYTYTKHPNGMLSSIVIDGPLTGSTDAVTQAFDDDGNLTSVSNSLGHTTTYANYNALGQPGRVTGPNGDITDYTYDARGRVSTEKRLVNSAWQTTTYKYNAAGLLESITRPDGQKRNYVYDAARRLVREYEAENATTFAQKRYTYNNMSLVTRIDTERTTTPLTAPTVSASPTTSSTGSYSVSWTTVGDTTAYRLEERLGSGSWVEIVNANVTTKAISGKTNGTYSYRARACNSAGCGPYSATVSVVVSLSGPPIAPTMTAPPGYSYGGNYNAAWGSVVGATSYRLEESGNGQGWLEIYNGTGTSRSFSKTVSATFSYRVRACNTAGCSAYSPTRTVTVEIESCPSCFAAPTPPEEGGEAVSSDEEGGQ